MASKRTSTARPVTQPTAAPEEDTARARYLYARYGLTMHDYDLLLVRQGHKCVICGTPHTTAHPLVVDHDHTRPVGQAVRGLLCGECNTGIGLLGDDPKLLRRAAEYLDIEGDYAGTIEARPAEALKAGEHAPTP